MSREQNKLIATYNQALLDETLSFNYVIRQTDFKSLQYAEYIRDKELKKYNESMDEFVFMNNEENVIPYYDGPKSKKFNISVVNESCIDTIERIVSDKNNLESDKAPLCVLNFASAKCIGGGYLAGSSAQEETLCRHTTLYRRLQRLQSKWEIKMSNDIEKIRGSYTHSYIYHKNIHLIRNSKLDPIYFDNMRIKCSAMFNIITCAAPNASVIKKHIEDPSVFNSYLYNVFINRIYHVLHKMASAGNKTIILGAWGCGVFGNNPQFVAHCFYDVLVSMGYRNIFDNIIFSITDRDKASLYEEVFKNFSRP